jgi:hypothetical protein
MACASAMNGPEISTIEREERAAFASCLGENQCIAQSQSKTTDVVHGHDIVSDAAKAFDDRERKILVGEQTGHSSMLDRAVFLQFAFDFFGAAGRVFPGVFKIGGVQHGITFENVAITPAGSADFHQQPDGNASPGDAGGAATDPRRPFNAGDVDARMTGPLPLVAGMEAFQLDRV